MSILMSSQRHKNEYILLFPAPFCNQSVLHFPFNLPNTMWITPYKRCIHLRFQSFPVIITSMVVPFNLIASEASQFLSDSHLLWTPKCLYLWHSVIKIVQQWKGYVTIMLHLNLTHLCLASNKFQCVQAIWYVYGIFVLHISTF